MTETTTQLTFPRTFGEHALANPYPAFNLLREAGPVHRMEVVDGVHAWVVTRFDEVQQVLNDPARLSSNPKFAPKEWLEEFGLLRDADGNFIVAENMLYADPPVHTRLRKLVAKAFTARRVEALRPRVQQVTDEILDRIGPRRHAELIYDYAFPIPLTIICELLGVPEDEREDFQTMSNSIMVGRPVDRAQVDATQWQMLGYLGQLIQRRRGELGDDMLSALITASDEDGQLNDIELLSMAALLLIAGQETSGNLLGNSLLELVRRPGALDELRADPALVPAAVEEFVRMLSPALGTWRFTVADVEIAGTAIPAGEAVLPLMVTANREPGRFSDPDRYDPHRAVESHVGFGHGLHFCLGASLGRMEAQIAIGTFAQRLTDVALAVPEDQLQWRPSLMRGLLELPVTFTAR